MKVKIEIDGNTHSGELFEDSNPKTIEALKENMPVSGTAQKWGKELFFRVPIDIDEENTKRYVNKGEIAYWPEGNALCIFYGMTPGSPSEDKIKPASAVNVIGKIDNPDELKGYSSDVKIKVSKEE